MSYRNTSPEKWEDGWFRKLPVNSKLLFLYICDKCDWAGFWEIDLELAAYFTRISKRAILGAKEGLKQAYIEHGKYLWLRNFIKRQRNWPLNPDNNCHKAILSILKSHSEFEVDFLDEMDIIKTPFLGPVQAPCNVVSCKGNVKEYTKEFLRFWTAYRRKEAKGYAFVAWQKIDSSLFEKVISAAAKQSSSWASRGSEMRFVPLPATWLNGRYYENEKTAITVSRDRPCVICGAPAGGEHMNKPLCSKPDCRDKIAAYIQAAYQKSKEK